MFFQTEAHRWSVRETCLETVIICAVIPIGVDSEPETAHSIFTHELQQWETACLLAPPKWFD